jgi:hypothetical protein
MAGLMLFPESYGGAVVDQATKQSTAQVAALLAKEVDMVKQSSAGQFALRMFEKYRL